MKLIVGLGNPGTTYSKTRHNIGFELVDALAKAHGIALTNRRDKAVTGRGIIAGQAVMLVKPQTYMNLSGDAVSAIAAKEGIERSNILVICDDINLPPGRMRLRSSGSAGGQNGLKDLIVKLDGEDFPRLRIGVGAPPAAGGEQVNWVLSKFSLADRKLMDEVLIAAMGAAELWLNEGTLAAANRFNGLVVTV
ncbi:aminoacyl-tRNA hydrolase [Armatimonas sp.]|uniref:aminoacyl-tRNA hydrolase n=1 Tax=Armatimonas sp. TaxID=1872638 RepID=UPI00286A8A84|nr:aminoacyl-tRNA hydrolase [Armatimonas sp.]